MKKIVFILTLIIGLGIGGTACAKDEYHHDANVLPVAAKTVIAKNFKSEVSVVKVEKDWGRVSEYEVILTDGSEISFDRDGNWDKVEVNYTRSVPAGFIPKGISSFVRQNQPNTRIIGIDKERRGYDIELSNGVEMKFDKNGNFLRYDD